MSCATGRMNSEYLRGILTTYLVSTMEEVANKLFFNARNDVIFPQDNDTKHKSRAMKNWLASIGMSTINGASQSPYLNPIYVCLMSGQALTW